MKRYLVRSGELKFAVDFLQRSSTVDAGGGEALNLDTATPVYAGWRAAIRTLSAFESDRAMARGMEASHEFTIRYYAGLDPDWVIRLGSGASARYFSIVGVLDVDEMHRKMVLTCKERTPVSGGHV